MKILKESKEELPISFLTTFVSDAWEEVGILKEDIKAIKKEFKGTADIENIIQDLIDAYLVCIGQLEGHLKDNNYIEVPDKIEENVEKAYSPLAEDLLVSITELDSDTANIEDVKAEETVEQPLTTSTIENNNIEKAQIIKEQPIEIKDEEEIDSNEILEKKDLETTTEDPKVGGDEFEYYCEFDEPNLSEKPLTDEDLYN